MLENVKAILTAQDNGFTSVFNKAAKVAEEVASRLTEGLGGAVKNIGRQAFNFISDGFGQMMDDLSSASASWQTFEANMTISGASADSISRVRDELQSYATETIYSASDMATTYSQLYAVLGDDGPVAVDALVMSFGGLASAAEDPQQAMRTLSTQATQMAAKPYVAWQDFKLMLEQSPAGMAAVADAMGMEMSELVAAVQDGTVKTEDFFVAMEQAGNSDAFSDMAKSYKTVDQAIGGLQETVVNKLLPVFETFQSLGINVVEGLIDAFDQLDLTTMTIGEAVTTLLNTFEAGLPEAAAQGMEMIQGFVQGAVEAIPGIITAASSLIMTFIEIIFDGLPDVLLMGVQIVGSLIDGIAQNLPSIIDRGLEALSNFGQGIMDNMPEIWNTALEMITALAQGIGESIPILIEKVPEMVGSFIDAIMNTDWLQVGLDIISAIGEGLFNGLSTVGGKVGEWFGGIGDWFAGGKQGGEEVSSGAAIGIDSGMGDVKAATDTGMGGAVDVIGRYAPEAETGAYQVGESTVEGLETSLVPAGEIGEDAMSRYTAGINSGSGSAERSVSNTSNNIVRSMTSTGPKARNAGMQTMGSYASGLSSGSSRAAATASTATTRVLAQLNKQSQAYQLGAYISIGFANGMQSQLGRIQAAANQMASAATRAIIAKARIGSPSKVTTELGRFYGMGFANGISDMFGTVMAASEKLVQIPELPSPRLAMADGPSLPDDYSTGRESMRIEVPLSVDGKEFARATAVYTQGELNVIQTRQQRKRGVRA